jgi:WD40 repeat protein
MKRRTLLAALPALASLLLLPDSNFAMPGKPALVCSSWPGVAHTLPQQEPQPDFCLPIETPFVYGVAISPDARYLAYCGYTPRGVFVWDLTKKQVAVTLDAGSREVRDVTFSPDGKVLAAGPADKGPHVKLWEVGSWKELASLQDDIYFRYMLGFSADSKHVLAAGGNGITAWEWATQQQLWRAQLKLRNPLSGLSTSPDGKLLAVGTQEKRCGNDDSPPRPGEVVVLTLKDGKEVFRHERHRSAVYQVVFSPDGKYVASAGDEQTVAIYDAQQGTGALFTIKGYGLDGVNTVAFAADSKTLLIGFERGGVLVMDVPSWKQIVHFAAKVPIRHLRVFAQGKKLLTVHERPEDGLLQIWDLEGILKSARAASNQK